MTNIQQSLDMETNLSLLGNKSSNGLIDNLKASKNTITDLKLVQDGDSILLAGRRIHLRHHIGNQASTGCQLGAGNRGKHHPGLNSNFFFFNCSEMSFRLPEIIISWQLTVCVDITPTALHILSCTVVAQTFFLLVVRVYSHTLTPCTCMAQVTKHITLSAVRPKNIYTSSRNVVRLAELDDTTHVHSFLTFSWISLPASRTTLRRSTATAEWRFDGTTTLYIFHDTNGRNPG